MWSWLGLDDRQDVAARVDEPGRPRVAHVGDAVGRHGIRLDVLLDRDATPAKLLDRGPDVRHPPSELGLRVRGADRALGDDQLGPGAAAEYDPVRVGPDDLEAQGVAVEREARVEVARQQDREDEM